jgi:PKD repeat protein
MKNYLISGLLLLFIAFYFPDTAAQISQGGTPRSFTRKMDFNEIPVKNPGKIELEKLRAEDEQRRQMGKEFDRRFGYSFLVDWNTGNSGRWVELENGDRLWQLRISCPEATSINLTFSSYWLPEGADLFIAGKKNHIGAFTSFNNQADEKLGTGILGGDEVLVEYFEPSSVRGQGKLAVGRITHGYRNPFSTQGWGDSQFCEVNVNCPEGQPWQNEKRSVAKIIDGGDLCTGALINNAAMDGKPYFLTANHCFNSSVTTWVFAFNWEAPGCETPAASFPETQTIAGCTLRARNAFSDFCLLELSAKPPADYNVYYAGWSAEDVPALKSTMIHHPAGDIKKITFDYDPAVSSGYGVGSTNNNSHWQTLNYELSTTEGGSSGCPQFDQNRRIVGQLHGGPASCTNVSSDFYGKFSQSWSAGTSNTTRLREWLDPNNTGISQMDGFDPSCRRLDVNLPWIKNLDTVAADLPHLWKMQNAGAPGGFALVQGGFFNTAGKAFRISSEIGTNLSRGDTLIVSPLGVSRYKRLSLKFRHAYRRKNELNSDTLSLLISRDCGNSFKLIGRYSGSELQTTPVSLVTQPYLPADTSEWRSNAISLDSTYNRAEQLVIAFLHKSGNSGTLWLDEIGLSGDTARNKPVARFESDKTGGCAGVNIQFADSSLYNPGSRIWYFDGGVPATSTDLNPVVQYNAAGNYTVRLVVTNEEGRDTLEKISYIKIQDIGVEETPFLQDFAQATGPFPGTGYVLLNPENNVTWVRSATVNAPGSAGGSLMFDNWSNPNVTGQTDLLVFPKILTAGKPHLKVRLKYAYKFYQGFGGNVSPDTLTIGRGADCGALFVPFWKKGGQSLATAGSTGSSYTPAAGDWQTVSLNLDSLLIYPEVSLAFQNKFGYGNRLYIDDISIDTSDNCPSAPVILANATSICSGQTLILSMDSIPNATYAWSGPNGFSSSSRVATRTVNILSGGSYTAAVTVNGCTSESSTISITIGSLPAVPAITQSGNTLSGPPGFTYTWLLNGDTLPVQTQSFSAEESGTYVLIVWNAAGCSRSSQPRNVVITSLQDFLSEGFSLYPNPAEDLIFVNHPSGDVRLLGLMNLLGQSFTPETITGRDIGFTISVRNLPSGTFWLILSEGKKNIRIPFQKK